MIPNHEATHWIDAGAIGVAMGAFMGWLPNIAALLTVIWMLLRVYEAYLNVVALRKEIAQKDKANAPIETVKEKVKTDDPQLKP